MADTFTVEREIRVDAPAAALYERIADFHRRRAWSPFEELDPEMQRKFEGPAAGVGAVYEWSGDMKLDGSGDGTTVTWTMTGPVTRMTRAMGVFRSMDKMVGPIFEKGLAKLKNEAEAN